MPTKIETHRVSKNWKSRKVENPEQRGDRHGDRRETGVEIDIEISVWWVWWGWHGGRFLGLVLVVGFLEVLVVGVVVWWRGWCLVVLGGGGMVARLVFVMTGVWIGAVI